ncbi:glycosyl transferase family protein [Blastomonas sp. CACIA14H2]|uniref:glycosyl transferase family protein n=1 Tax=Blastomonas sp. CACIA14H2 TaxID=1419876 RepID=UPI00040920A9
MPGGSTLGQKVEGFADGLLAGPLANLFASLDFAATELLLFAGIWFVIGAFDDLALDLAWLWQTLTAQRRDSHIAPHRAPGDAPTASPEFAVFVPAWDEAEVIGDMVAHCLARWPTRDYRLYIGTYANDPATAAAARESARGDARVRVVMLDIAGPTSKADCLNGLWHAMRADEAARGWSFRAVVLHDAEDVVHPAELGLYRHALADHDFVQIPVRPLIDPRARLISGHYADEFAEAHLRKMPVRSRLGVAMPCAGVGCAFRREVLQALGHGGAGEAPFATDSLTEDYELGIRIHESGGRGIFVRARDGAGDLIATRAYFPADLGASVRQKTRWMIGIALSGWDRTGWGGSAGDLWMRARDRRAALAAVVLVAGYLGLLLWSVVGIASALGIYAPAPPDAAARVLLIVTGCTLVWRLAIRAACTGWEHGWAEACWSIPRALVSNIIAVMAARRALVAYAASLGGAALPWDKTRHRIPAALPAKLPASDPAGVPMAARHG